MAPIVVVTGASKGIGAAIVGELCKIPGITVIGVARGPMSSAQSSKNFIPIQGDVRSESTCKAVIEASKNSQIKGLILNAGSPLPLGPVASLPFGQIEECLGLNLHSPIMWTQALLPHLRSSKGRLIYLSSSLIIRPNGMTPCWAPLTAAKAGMTAFLGVLGREEPSITSMAVSPGMVNTEGLRQAAVTCPPPTGPMLKKMSAGFLNPILPASAIVKLILAAPSSKSGHFIEWNEKWIGDLNVAQ